MSATLHAVTVADGRTCWSILTADTGRVPCSRYGYDSESCAPAAIITAMIVADAIGTDLTEADLDHAMSMVVNNHDDPASLIVNHGHDMLAAYGLTIADFLDDEDAADAREDHDR